MKTLQFTRDELQREARDLYRQMTLRRAATMLDVPPSQVARWRDGARLTDRMALRVAVSIVAREMGMVGTFGRIDTRETRIEARHDNPCERVLVRVSSANDDAGVREWRV